MRKLSINIFLLISVVTISLTGCLKSYPINADPKATTNIITMEYYTGSGTTTLNSGLTYFGSGALTYPPTDDADTATYSVIIGGGKTVSQDVTVTIGADANALLDNFSTDSITYVAMPDSLYHLISNTATIKAGTNSAVFQIVFYPSKIDPTQNFILPLTVTSNTANYKMSSNFGHIYFHTIGNPIAGAYENQWIRWNTLDTTTTPAYNEDEGSVILAPTNPTTVTVSNATGITYIITFTNTNGTPSDFAVSLDGASVKSAGITITGGPYVDKADPVKGIYRFRFTYLNSSGAARTIIDQYVK